MLEFPLALLIGFMISTIDDGKDAATMFAPKLDLVLWFMALLLGFISFVHWAVVKTLRDTAAEEDLRRLRRGVHWVAGTLWELSMFAISIGLIFVGAKTPIAGPWLLALVGTFFVWVHRRLERSFPAMVGW